MEREEITQKAFDYFQAGFNCAEAVSKTITESYANERAAGIPNAATGFGGGVGGSKCETCGALTGGVIALGSLFGRTNPGEDKQRIYELATEFRNRFLDTFGSTHCRTILDGFGKQENLLKCKRLTGEAAGILHDILQEEREESSQQQ